MFESRQLPGEAENYRDVIQDCHRLSVWLLIESSLAESIPLEPEREDGFKHTAEEEKDGAALTAV